MPPVSSKKQYDAALTAVQRELAMLRDRGRCQWCRKPGASDMSHIYGKGAHPALKHELDNVLMMHSACHHAGWHADWPASLAWFEKHFPRRFARLAERIHAARGERSVPVDFYKDKLAAMRDELGKKKQEQQQGVKR